MATPEDINRQFKQEVTGLEQAVQAAAGDPAEQIPPYPSDSHDHSYSSVVRLRWVASVIGKVTAAHDAEKALLTERISQLEAELTAR